MEARAAGHDPLLEVAGLKTQFFTRDGIVKAVDGVSFTVDRGEILGIVGESGCGKSVTARSILRLVPDPPGRIVDGHILFDGVDLAGLSASQMQDIRGDRISMIFQDPMVSLNPTMRVGRQVIEVLVRHRGMTERAARERAIALLDAVRIPAAAERLDDYPHQFSGGMRQRAMIAMALACEPNLLIADEPTTALDVTVQAQILDLIRRIRREHDTAVILITHDLGVVAEICDRVSVMYAGQVVEEAGVEDLFDNPRHPYTQGLLQSIPSPEQRVEELKPIRGQPPDLSRLPQGCAFAPRCDHRMARCRDESPPTRDFGGGHLSRCWLPAADAVDADAVVAS